jgi:glycine/serine hydroxymethyltransferase
MKEPEMIEIGHLISEIISTNKVEQAIKDRISKLCRDFPLYENGVE